MHRTHMHKKILKKKKTHARLIAWHTKKIIKTFFASLHGAPKKYTKYTKTPFCHLKRGAKKNKKHKTHKKKTQGPLNFSAQFLESIFVRVLWLTITSRVAI